MRELYFCNNGEFDISAMLTLGVSVKDNDDAIGFFGTGFKYAVSIILRLNGSIKVETCGNTFEFTKETREIRGKSFDFVLVNGKEAGFTTHLGTNWEAWMAFREIYCNCMDEFGEVGFERLEMDTVVTVRCNEIETAYYDRSKYFISGEPVLSTALVDIYEGFSPYIYYRGVAVQEQFKNNGRYSYNIKRSIDLTEDRTAKYNFQVLHPIIQAIQTCTNESFLRKAVTASPDSFEGVLGYEPEWTTSKEFISVVSELMASGAVVTEAARKVLRAHQAEAGDWPTFELTNVQQSMLNKSISFLKAIDINVDDFPIKTVNGLGNGVMGRALDSVIYLSDISFHMGTKQVASTLMEEWVHNKYGVKDFDRQMQSWLFDKILSLGEEMKGEPL